MYKYKSPPRDSNPLLFNHEKKECFEKNVALSTVA